MNPQVAGVLEALSMFVARTYNAFSRIGATEMRPFALDGEPDGLGAAVLWTLCAKKLTFFLFFRI